MNAKREVEVVAISDIHLGTVGCRALELTQYLNSIQPQKLILNGDIFDIWNFKKYYWPENHFLVIKSILNLMTSGTEVFYLTGNHDELLRKISSLHLGNLHIKDKLVLNLDGKQNWFFHGDVFDVTMRYSKWLAKMGAVGYDMLIMLNNAINMGLHSFGRSKISLSRKIKNSVKQAVKFVEDFEMTAMELAIDNGYEYVVCGHIHQPKIKRYSNGKGKVTYLNSGDWIENLTALEYNHGEWNLYHYNKEEFIGAEMYDLPVITATPLNEILEVA